MAVKEYSVIKAVKMLRRTQAPWINPVESLQNMNRLKNLYILDQYDV